MSPRRRIAVEGIGIAPVCIDVQGAIVTFDIGSGYRINNYRSSFTANGM